MERYPRMLRVWLQFLRKHPPSWRVWTRIHLWHPPFFPVVFNRSCQTYLNSNMTQPHSLYSLFRNSSKKRSLKTSLTPLRIIPSTNFQIPFRLQIPPRALPTIQLVFFRAPTAINQFANLPSRSLLVTSNYRNLNKKKDLYSLLRQIRISKAPVVRRQRPQNIWWTPFICQWNMW